LTGAEYKQCYRVPIIRKNKPSKRLTKYQLNIEKRLRQKILYDIINSQLNYRSVQKLGKSVCYGTAPATVRT
jgi:hypothetical protein